MKCLNRNKQKFHYSLYLEKREIEDDYGNATGEYEVVYSNPYVCYGNISAAKGEIQTRQFGDGEIYDKVIVLDNPKTPIDEYSILWIDSSPLLNGDGSLVTNEEGLIITPHDYIVKKVARSLNNVSVAVSKVTVR